MNTHVTKAVNKACLELQRKMASQTALRQALEPYAPLIDALNVTVGIKSAYTNSYHRRCTVVLQPLTLDKAQEVARDIGSVLQITGVSKYTGIEVSMPVSDRLWVQVNLSDVTIAECYEAGILKTNFGEPAVYYSAVCSTGL